MAGLALWLITTVYSLFLPARGGRSMFSTTLAGFSVLSLRHGRADSFQAIHSRARWSLPAHEAPLPGFCVAQAIR